MIAVVTARLLLDYNTIHSSISIVLRTDHVATRIARSSRSPHFLEGDEHQRYISGMLRTRYPEFDPLENDLQNRAYNVRL